MASDGYTIKLWDVASGRERATFKGHNDDIRALIYTPDGKTLVSGSGDGEKRLWEAATGRVRAILKGQTRGVACLAVTADGKTLASGSFDHTVKLWDLATG